MTLKMRLDSGYCRACDRRGCCRIGRGSPRWRPQRTISARLTITVWRKACAGIGYVDAIVIAAQVNGDAGSHSAGKAFQSLQAK